MISSHPLVSPPTHNQRTRPICYLSWIAITSLHRARPLPAQSTHYCVPNPVPRPSHPQFNRERQSVGVCWPSNHNLSGHCGGRTMARTLAATRFSSLDSKVYKQRDFWTGGQLSLRPAMSSWAYLGNSLLYHQSLHCLSTRPAPPAPLARAMECQAMMSLSSGADVSINDQTLRGTSGRRLDYFMLLLSTRGDLVIGQGMWTMLWSVSIRL